MKTSVLLAVDDRSDNLFVLEQLLSEYIPECRVVSAQSASQGLALAGENPVDIAVVDVQMPGMDGIEMCRHLKENPKTADIPVILITAHSTTSEFRVRGLEAGADDFISRPMDGIELAARIKVMLRIGKAESTLRRQKDQLEGLVRERTENLRRINRAYHALSEINHLMVHAQGEKELLKEACSILVEIGGYRMVWVGRAEEDEEKTVRPVVHAGYEEGYLNAINISWAEKTEGMGPTGLAIRTGEPHTARNIKTPEDPNYAFWRKDALKRGYVSSIALPLKGADRIWGALNIYSGSEDAFDTEEITLLTRMAEDLGYGILSLQTKNAMDDALVALQKSQKMEALGTLAGGIAHDFNNILAAILGYTELAFMDTRSAERIESDLKEILKAGRRAKDLVTQILSFSRQDSPDLKPTLIHLIVKEALSLLRASLPTSIEFRSDLDANTGVILGNPSQIHQVLMNLCTNASHAMKEKGGRLEVTLGNVEYEGDNGKLNLAPGNYVNLTVRDTGHGMTPEVLERAFDPYFTTKEKGAGTGLGLSVVHGIVKGHGGTFQVESILGKGTLFQIYFPRTEKAVGEEEERAENLPKGNEKVLFVDDEPSLVKMAQQLLEELGYKVTTTTSSLEALELFQDDPHRFHLLITDMTMPGLTGDLLSLEIFKVRPDMPIVICTGFTERISEAEALDMGVKAMLTKPVSSHRLARVVREVLDGKML